MKFTKAELKVIFSTLVHHLDKLDAISILEEHFAIENGKRINTKETKLIKSILNKIQPVLSKGHSICGVYYE